MIEPQECPEPQRVYPAQVIKWRDGDTVEVWVDQGFNHRTKVALRLRGIDCPEKKVDYAGWEAAKYAAWAIAPPESWVTVRTYKPAPETFDRYVADVWRPQVQRAGVEVDIAAALLESGYAIPRGDVYS